MSSQDIFDETSDTLNRCTIPQLKALLEFHNVSVSTKLKKKADIVSLCLEHNISEVPSHIATPRKAKKTMSRRSSTTFSFSTSEDEAAVNQRRSTVAGDQLLFDLHDSENSPVPLQQTESPSQPRAKAKPAKTVEQSAEEPTEEPTEEPEPAETSQDATAAAVFDQEQTAASPVGQNEDEQASSSSSSSSSLRRSSSSRSRSRSRSRSSSMSEATDEQQTAKLDSMLSAVEQAEEESVTNVEDQQSAVVVEPVADATPLPISSSVAVVAPPTTTHSQSVFSLLHRLNTPAFGLVCASGVLAHIGLCYYMLSHPPHWADFGYPLLGLAGVMLVMIVLGCYDEWFLKEYGAQPVFPPRPSHSLLSDDQLASTATTTALLSQPSVARSVSTASEFEQLRAAAIQILAEERSLLCQAIENLESQIRELTPQAIDPATSATASRPLRKASRDLASTIHTLANVQAFFSVVATAEEDPEIVAILRAFAGPASSNN